MKRPVTIEKFTATRWLEAKEAERRAEERFHLAGIVSGVVIAVVVAILAIGVWLS